MLIAPLKNLTTGLLALTLIAMVCISVMSDADASDTVQAFPEITIYFNAYSSVSGIQYRLSDIARIEGNNKSLLHRLEALNLGRSPKLGNRVVWSARQLENHLERMGLQEDEAFLDIPKRVVVERASQQVETHRIRLFLEQALLEEAAFDNAIIDRFRIPNALQLPAGDLQMTVEFRMPRKKTGTVPYRLDLIVDGEVYRTLNGTIHLDQMVQVLEVTSPIQRGEPIAINQVVSVEHRLSSIRGKMIRAESVLHLMKQSGSSLRAKRNLAQGEVLGWNTMEREVLVKRGQSVQMILENPTGMRITTKGRSNQSGSLGDIIEVVNISSGRKVQGVISGRQIVSVAY